MNESLNDDIFNYLVVFCSQLANMVKRFKDKIVRGDSKVPYLL